MKILSFLGLALVLNAPMLSGQGAGRIAGGSGSIEILRGTVWTQAMPNDQLAEGEKVRTGAASFVTLDLASGSILTLASDTEVEFQQNTVLLTSGTLKTFAPTALVLSTQAGRIQGVQYPVEMQVAVAGNSTPEISVTSGSVRAGGVVLRASADSMYRTYTAGRRRSRQGADVPAIPNIYVLPQVNQAPYTDFSPWIDGLRPPYQAPFAPRIRPRD